MPTLDELAAIREWLYTHTHHLGGRPLAKRNTLAVVDLLEQRGIGGDVVECGVWLGVNMILSKAYIDRAGYMPRKHWLYDTFEGMPRPGEFDIKIKTGRPSVWREGWCYCARDEVRRNFAEFNALDSNVVFVKGMVEQTLRDPRNLPKHIAFLRLDTDWYSSTKVELEILYPRLVTGGVLVIDDYGFWDGARRATDEYFGRPLHFAKIDTPARMLIKP